MELASETLPVMPVLYMSNLLWPQHTALSGTRFHHMGNCFTALWEQHVIVCAPVIRLDISGFHLISQCTT